VCPFFALMRFNMPPALSPPLHRCTVNCDLFRMRDTRLTNFSFPALSATVSRPTLRSFAFFNFAVSVYYLISLTPVPAVFRSFVRSFVHSFAHSFARSLIVPETLHFRLFPDDGFFLTMPSIQACPICMMNTSISSAAFVKNKCRTNVL